MVLYLTPLELISRIAALVPAPRVHRHRYYGVLAPNARLCPAVTALLGADNEAAIEPEVDVTLPFDPEEETAQRSPARYAIGAKISRRALIRY